MIPPQHNYELRIEALPAFADNYVWLIHDGRDAIAVDPGDAAPVRETLQARSLRLRTILLTHHHSDHVAGAAALKAATGAQIYGPAAESDKIGSLDHLLSDGDRVELSAPQLRLDVLAIPGHTLGHIAYHAAQPAPGLLFCGDTLFSAGCGRLFEGSPQQMLDSLQRLAALPASTAVYCGHEYTLANLQFAQTVEPSNAAIEAALHEVRGWRKANRPSLPSTIERERCINPFLRSAETAVRDAVGRHVGRDPGTADRVFAALRQWKDGYHPPPV